MSVQELVKLLIMARNYHISQCVNVETCAECDYKDVNCKCLHVAEYLIKHGIDSEHVKHGRWKGNGMGDFACSLCSNEVSGNFYPYCPYCRAKMDEVYHE